MWADYAVHAQCRNKQAHAHANNLGTLDHSYLSWLSHCGLIPGLKPKEWNGAIKLLLSLVHLKNEGKKKKNERKNAQAGNDLLTGPP